MLKIFNYFLYLLMILFVLMIVCGLTVLCFMKFAWNVLFNVLYVRKLFRGGGLFDHGCRETSQTGAFCFTSLQKVAWNKFLLLLQKCWFLIMCGFRKLNCASKFYQTILLVLWSDQLNWNGTGYNLGKINFCYFFINIVDNPRCC